jgi:hypothetical protein
MTDYKKYSLGQVENFLYDAMSTDATPQEIYDVIVGVVKDNLEVYTKSANDARQLLDLLNGGYIRPKAKLVIPPTTCDKEDTSEECKRSWNDFWEDSHYSDEELDAMCDAATSAKMGKVNKWILPVEEDGDDCVVTFPDDLLNAANLTEGDQIEWIDQHDGSYLMRKVDGII